MALQYHPMRHRQKHELGIDEGYKLTIAFEN